jgi:hypothetical protein
VQLKTARLCLNCDEVHNAQTCPVCVSETFVYLTRWVPRSQPVTRRVAPPVFAATVPHRAVAGCGALSQVAAGLYGCFKRVQSRIELMALRKAGELR